MQFSFFSRDYFCNCGDIQLSGKHYQSLLNHCFQFSRYFSLFIYDNEIPFVKELNKWQIDAPAMLNKDIAKHGVQQFYKSTVDAQKTIHVWTKSLFDFSSSEKRGYPEDIAFYREDGTRFFDSIIHEGECSIYPRPDENIDELLKFGGWLPINADGIPEVPAADHQLPTGSWQLDQSDRLYILLMEIRKLPARYLAEKSIEALEALISGYRPAGCENFPQNASSEFNFLPRWYIAFRFFVLGECNALTTDSLATAFRKAGFRGEMGYVKFFELLDQFCVKAITASSF